MIRVPEGALRVEIDDPKDRSIQKPAGVIRGWFATRNIDPPDEFHFQVGAVNLPHSVAERVDVQEVMPDCSIVGFDIRYDLMNHLPQIDDNRLDIQLFIPGYDSVRLRFKIKDSALAICVAAAGGV